MTISPLSIHAGKPELDPDDFLSMQACEEKSHHEFIWKATLEEIHPIRVREDDLSAGLTAERNARCPLHERPITN